MRHLERVARLNLLIAVFTCMALTASGQKGNNSTEVVQGLVKQHEAWLYRLSTPGASIRGIQTAKQGSVFHYHIYVSGLPNDRVYDVLSWPIGQQKPSTVFPGVSLGKDGIVMCSGRLPGECNDPSSEDHGVVNFAFSADSGEPIRLGLVSDNQRATGVIVPDPIGGTDRGCSLSVERLSPHFEIAYVTGEGYPPATEVSFSATSYHEAHPIKVATDDKGTLHFAMLPYVVGHDQGTTQLQTSGLTGCSPRAEFRWGD